MRKLVFYPLLFLLTACIEDRHGLNNIIGYVPVYQPAATAHQITTGSPEATVSAGKIYAYKNYLFQVEQGKGIHVVDNSLPRQARKISFITVPGCSELAIKSDFMYVNNINDLVVISLANVAAPVVVGRREGAFPQVNQQYPPFNNVYFECPDPEKGIVTGWEEKRMDNPKCRR